MKEIKSILKGYKPSPLGPIPNDWESTELKYVANKIMVGIATEVKPHVRNTGIPILRNQNIRENYLDDSDVIYITEEFDRTNKNKRVKVGDILIVRTGSNVGQACIVNPKFNDAQTFTTLIVRPGDRLNSDFLSMHINSFGIQEVERLSAGGGKPNLNAGFLHSYRIALPKIEEQRRIAELIFSWDKYINTHTQLIDQKELRKKWLMQQLLTGKKRLKGFEKGKWKIQSLENFIKPIVRAVEKPNDAYIGIGLRSHGKGTFLKPNEQPENNSMDTFYVVRKNDLILNITFAWEQAIAIVRPEDDGALASHRFPTYNFIKKRGFADFFRFFILQPRMKYALELISPGGAGRNRVMSKSDFIKLEFLLPEYEEQAAIAQVLQSSDAELNLLRKKLDKLKEQKKGLMQMLLTGKKRLRIK